MSQYPPYSRPHTAIPWPIAAMPAYTGGFLAPVPFFYAAVKLRLRKLWLIAGVYAAIWTIPWVLFALVPDNHVVSRLHDRLALVLAVGGTVHAFLLRGSLPLRSRPQRGMVRKQPVNAPVTVPASDPTQTMCSEVRAELGSLKSSLRTHAELFTSSCQQLLVETIGQMEQVVSFVASGGHADTELRSVHAIATDYLPTSINTYVRLPREYAVSQRNSAGRTAADELELELRLLRDKTKEAADSLHRIDALRLEQQSAFLRAKFGKSELDLP